MIKMTKQLLVLNIALIIASISISSCVEKEVIIPDFMPPPSDKVVLVEELTGVSCPNCPSGSATLQGLITIFDGAVIGVGIHGDFLASPIEGHSIYDFRNAVGSELEQYFSPFLGKPAASINRIHFPGQDFLTIATPALWQQFIEAEFAKPNVLTLEKEISYDPETRLVSVSVGAIPLVDLAGDYNISVMVLESHIIDSQKDQTVIIDDYEHNHALRDMMTATLGDFLGSNLTAGSIIKKSYTYTLPISDGTWNPENMEIVISVARVDNGGQEVIQAIEGHVVE
jgi:hypothetical protein